MNSKTSDVLRRLDLFEAALYGELEGEIRRDDISLALYSTDGSMYQIMPLAVCIPKTTRDVARIVEVAASLDLPVLPRGGASSLAGQTVGEAVVIDFTRHLNRILSIDPDRKVAVVEPGVVLDDLNLALRPHGLMVGPDPASSNRATLGGMVANNSTGTHSILYGNVERHIESVECILADGSSASFGPQSEDEWTASLSAPGFEGEIRRGIDEIIRNRGSVIARDTPGHWRRNSGYRLETMLGDADADAGQRNIARLICGSEGTLAVVTKVAIRLVERPAFTSVGVVHFYTRDEALRAVADILETGPSAVELLDGVAIKQCRTVPSFFARMGFVVGDPGAVLITEYYGKSEGEVADKLAGLDGIGYSVVRRTTAAEIADVWFVRKEALGLIIGIKGDYKPLAFIEDASVPIPNLASYVAQLDAFIRTTETPVVYYAHASGGCLHVRPFIDTKRSSEIEKMVRISRASMELVRSLGGSVSSEHGDGLARSWLNRDILGPELYEANRELKRCFDPHNIMNPGKVVDAPPMDENLRFGAGYRTEAVEEQLDFSLDGGFARSIELCTGMGTCRKTLTGTMCPSFMVTFDEKDSTRGRANALRAAMSGRIGSDQLYSDQMHDVMDLCIQCKACKSECPSAVDMAAIKTEWLYHYRKANGVPLRDRIFARMPDVGRLATGRFASLVNLLNSNPVSRTLMEWTVGIDRKRPLPSFARRSFVQEVAMEKGGEFDATADAPTVVPTVVLFPDTFNNYNDPHIARAAYDVLRKVGYHVIVPTEPVCCGRTRFSKGDLDGARATVSATADVLHPFAASNFPIIGLEPSCIHTFGDEGRRVLPDDDRLATIGDACVSFERFVAEDRDGLFAAASWNPPVASVLYHGHCHQKSIEGTAWASSALARAAESIEVVDSGCCGMAGSFGYEVEHVGTSVAMAERRLAPAIRATRDDTVIVASGSSCRSQIRDVTGRRAYHPAEVFGLT